jgi:hypothetical protein
MIGKLERVPLREVWKHEALDFTQWLENNIEVLNDCIDLNLVNVEREQSAGSFNVDLVAEEEGGGTVVIENQLEKSDHDHLGKLITYLTAMDAKAAVWIVSQPRPEHVSAISWLNESTCADFYLIKLEAIRIEGSAAAALLTPIVVPSEEAKLVGKTKKEIAERYTIRKQWWISLIDRSRAKTKLHSHITPGEYSWIGVSAGHRGLNFNYTIVQHGCGAELYIDRGKDCAEENAQIFSQFEAQKDNIEAAFGGALSWERLEGKRACRITHRMEDGGYRSNEDEWPTIQDKLVGVMVRLESALRPVLAKLRLN